MKTGTPGVHLNPSSPPNGDYTEGKSVQISRGSDVDSVGIRSQLGQPFRIGTQSDSQDIFFKPHGVGRLVIESALTDDLGVDSLPQNQAMEVILFFKFQFFF